MLSCPDSSSGKDFDAEQEEEPSPNDCDLDVRRSVSVDLAHKGRDERPVVSRSAVSKGASGDWFFSMGSTEIPAVVVVVAVGTSCETVRASSGTTDCQQLGLTSWWWQARSRPSVK